MELDIFGSQGIIINESVFSPYYVPPTLVAREKQLLQLGKVLRPALFYQRPMNIYIYGPKGSGKTVTVRYVLQLLKEKAERIHVVYCTCSETNTFYKFIYLLAKHFRPEISKISSAEALEIIRQCCRPLTLVVIDDIHTLSSRKELNSIVFWSSRTELPLSFIYVAAKDITPRLEEDTLSSFKMNLYQIYFGPYTANELYQILTQRAKLGLKEGSYDDSVLRKIAAIVAKKSGDAREAIEILHYSAKIAEEEGDNKIKPEYVDRAINEIEYGYWINKIKSLPPTLKYIVLSYIQARRSGKQPVTTGEAYHLFYKQLAPNPISYYWFSKYTTYLISEEILEVVRREGNKRFININIPDEVLGEIEKIIEGEL
ncbi:MAG: AAA family ATPase [bacterium]|nr:AAA family ATPase [bacterium]